MRVAQCNNNIHSTVIVS